MPRLKNLVGWKGQDTSKQAALDLEPMTARQQVLSLIDNKGPLTDWELAEWLQALCNWPVEKRVTPRRRELVLEGKLVRENFKRANPKTGKEAYAWRRTTGHEEAYYRDLYANKKKKKKITGTWTRCPHCDEKHYVHFTDVQY